MSVFFYRLLINSVDLTGYLPSLLAQVHLTLDRNTGLGIVIDNDRGHDIFVTFLHEILCVKHIRRKTSRGKIKFSAFQAHPVNA